LVEISPGNYRRCSRCSKVFKSRRGCGDHIKDVHNGDGERVPVGASKSRKEYEPSMAELFIDAELADAMGEAVPDYIRDMMP